MRRFIVAAFIASFSFAPLSFAADAAPDAPILAPQAPGAEERLTVTGVAPKSATPTSARVNPGIPPGVAANGQEGWVHLKLMLSPSGKVTDAKIVESYPKGLFDKEVMDVVPGWAFKPPVGDGAYDVAVAFYMTQYRVKRGKGYGYVMDQQLVRERNDPSWRGLRAYYFQHFERLKRALDRGDLDEAGQRIKILKDDYNAGKLQITEIVRTYTMLTRYLRLTGHCELALNEARRALLMARYMDNAKLVYGVHIEVMSCLLELKRNDDAVDYYDSWRKVSRDGMSKEGEALMEDLRGQGFGKGVEFSIVDFYDANTKQAENPDSTLQVAVEVLAITFPAPPDSRSLLD